MTPTREKLLKYPTAVGRLAIVIINNVYCIPTYCAWMVMLTPLKRLNPKIYYKIEGLFFHWLLSVVSMWSYSAGYDIVEAGDDISVCKNKRTLVIANHQSTADVPLLMANFNTKENILPNLMWIMDRLFKFTNFGIVSIIHQDFFISAGRQKRDESINALRNHIKTSFLKLDRKWMVLFPEGGFLRKRRATSQRFAEKNNLPKLEHVTLPRVGAFKAIIETMKIEKDYINNTTTSASANINTDNITIDNDKKICDNNDLLNNEDLNENLMKSTSTIKARKNCTKSSSIAKSSTTKNNLNNSPSQISLHSSPTDSISNGDLSNKSSDSTASNSSDSLLEYILDITIAYPNGKPLDLPNIAHGWRDPCKTYMLYRLYKVSEIPKEETALTQWLYDRFIEKNDLLQNFYTYGKFYTDKTITTNLIQQDVLRLVLINLFFITSTYLHLQFIYAIYSYYNILVYSVL